MAVGGAAAGRARAGQDRYLPPPGSAGQLHNLRVFAAVAEAGSIARAGAQLFRAASAVTRSVIDLERALGVQLLERKPRGLLLTAYGEAALVRARRIEAEVESALADLLPPGTEGQPPATSGLLALLSSGRKLLLLSEVAALANVSAAADRLDLSQSGVSMALGRIEATLGRQLFQRQAEGMVANAAGERIALHAERAFAELRHLESDLARIGGGIGGAVVVGTTPLGRTHVFTAAIAEASAAHPDLRVVTIESDYRELAEGLRHGQIDLVVAVLRPDPAPGLTAERLFVDHLALLLRAGHPLLAGGRVPTLPDILAQRWILPRSTLLGRSVIEGCFRAIGAAPPRPAIETGDPQIVRQLLAATDMIAATSPHQFTPELAAGTLVRLPHSLPGAYREIGLILRDGALLSPAATALADAIRRHARGQEGTADQS